MAKKLHDYGQEIKPAFNRGIGLLKELEMAKYALMHTSIFLLQHPLLRPFLFFSEPQSQLRNLYKNDRNFRTPRPVHP